MKPVIFWTAFSLFLVVYGCGYFGITFPQLISSYGSDLLCLPIVLQLIWVAVRFLKNDPTLVLDWKHITAVTLLFSVYFEWYLPTCNPRYTADWIDVILYVAGAVVFFMIQRKNNSKKQILH